MSGTTGSPCGLKGGHGAAVHPLTVGQSPRRNRLRSLGWASSSLIVFKFRRSQSEMVDGQVIG